MLILDRLSRAERPLAVALGTFDGMHTGHVRLIARLVEEAKARGLEPAVLTFDRHPMETLAPKAAPGILTDTVQRRLIGASLGIAQWAEVPFTPEFASLQPGEFVQRCLVPAGTALVAAGFNYRFGAGGAGDPDFLVRAGKDLGFEVLTVPAETWEGEPVSSSRIRAAIGAGEMASAEKMLGRPYVLRGLVDSGVFRVPAGRCLPPEGQYRVRLRWSSGETRESGALQRGGMFYLTGSVPEGPAELLLGGKAAPRS